MSNDNIRIKDIEGNAQQITDLCKNLGFDLNSYLNNKPQKKIISSIWLWILIPSFFVLTCLLWIVIVDPVLTKISVLGLFLILGIAIFIIHHNYDNWVISCIAGGTGLSLILICLNVYTPAELAKKT